MAKIFVAESVYRTKKEATERAKILDRRGYDTDIRIDPKDPLKFYTVYRKKRDTKKR